MATPSVGLTNTVRPEAGSHSSPASSPARESGKNSDIELLIRRVSELETHAEEADRPWYRVPATLLPIVVSIFALAVSIYFPITEERQHAREELSSDVETVTTLVGQIIDLRKENSEKMASARDPELFQTESRLLNSKKLALQERVMKLLNDPKINSKVDPSVVQVFAYEVGQSGEESVAKHLLKNLLKRTTIDDWQRASASSSLAYWEMLPDSAPAEIEDGRRNMQNAVTFYRSQPGERSKEILVNMHAQWAKQEFLVNNRIGAKDELQAALASLDHLHPLNLDKPWLQRSYSEIERLVDGSERGLPGVLTDAEARRWYGSWTVRIIKPVETTGSLIITPNKQTNLVEARLDLFKNNVLVEKFVGSGSLLDASSMRIDWLGVVRAGNVPGYPPTQSYGYAVIHLVASNRLGIETYLLGEPEVQGRGVKASNSGEAVVSGTPRSKDDLRTTKSLLSDRTR